MPGPYPRGFLEYKLYRGGRYTVLGFPAGTLIVDPVEYRLIYTSRCCHLDQLGTARPGIQVLSLPTGVALILLGGYPIPGVYNREGARDMERSKRF